MPRPLAACILLAFAAAGLGASPVSAKGPPDWHILLRLRDRDRLRDWRTTWTAAADQVRAAGQGDRLAREGVLLQPDAAEVPPDLPPGDYRCRSFKLGAVPPGTATYVPGLWHGQTLQTGAIPPGTPTFVAQPAVPCRAGKDMFAVGGGVQRPAGRLWRWDGLRTLFLGSLAIGDEGKAMSYGYDPDRDVAGFLERIGPDRWRLVIPKPPWGGQIEVVEIVPAAAGA